MFLKEQHIIGWKTRQFSQHGNGGNGYTVLAIFFKSNWIFFFKAQFFKTCDKMIQYSSGFKTLSVLKICLRSISTLKIVNYYQGTFCTPGKSLINFSHQWRNDSLITTEIASMTIKQFQLLPGFLILTRNQYRTQRILKGVILKEKKDHWEPSGLSSKHIFCLQ